MQAPPSLLGVAAQAPDFGSQLSVVHGSPSSQVFASPAHVPAAQASLSVQGLASSQLAVFEAVWQPFVLSQLSAVQGLASSHFNGANWQTPVFASQAFAVQASPSSQSVFA